MFSFIHAWISAWVNNCEAGDLRRNPAHYDIIVMCVFDWYESDLFYPHLLGRVQMRWANHAIMGK